MAIYLLWHGVVRPTCLNLPDDVPLHWEDDPILRYTPTTQAF